MTKKPMNSLFLDYLLQSDIEIEAKVEKWEKESSLRENIDEISETVDEHLMFMMACWGEIGWCLPKWKKSDIKLGRVLADIKNNISIDVIDEGLSDCFTERDVDSLSVFIQRHLPDSEKKKIDLAFELYLKHEYFASAVLLAGLIDSVSINQFMKTNPAPANVSQCWKCYGNVIQDNFGGTYFSGDFPANKSAKDDKRANGTIDFFKSIKNDSCFDHKKEILIPLSFALLKFFEDSDWKDKKNGMIPSSINRHWLAHNMYDYDDITRADCIKLFCMLYQMVELYSML